jgi:hypothetical protein
MGRSAAAGLVAGTGSFCVVVAVVWSLMLTYSKPTCLSTVAWSQ